MFSIYFKKIMRLSLVLIVPFLGTELAHGSPQKEEKISPLVSVSWLKKNLSKKNLVILEVSSLRAYQDGHIKGARHIDGMKQLNETRKNIKYECKTNGKKMEILLRSLGVNQDSHVLLVWHGKKIKMAYHATKSYFVLTHFGVKVSILDGGMMAWKKAGMTVTQKIPDVKMGNITLRKFNFSDLAKKEDLLKGTFPVVDTRTLPFYEGRKKKKYVARMGTIPRSSHLSFLSFLKKDGTFQDKSVTLTIFQKKKFQSGSILFCNSGSVASVVWFMGHIYGKNPKLYDGSLNEWAKDPNCKMVKGK